MKINNELFEGNYLRKVTKIIENRKIAPKILLDNKSLNWPY